MPRLIPLEAYQRIQRQVRDVVESAGEAITFRKFDNITPGKPEFGLGDTLNYTERTIKAIIHVASLPQRETEGGQIIFGKITVDSTEHFTSQDEIVWRGSKYRVDSECVPIIIGSAVYWRSQLSRVN